MGDRTVAEGVALAEKARALKESWAATLRVDCLVVRGEVVSGPAFQATPATTQYARSGDASIAFQVTGQGGIDLLLVMPWLSHVEHAWEAPRCVGSSSVSARLRAYPV